MRLTITLSIVVCCVLSRSKAAKISVTEAFAVDKFATGSKRERFSGG